MNREILIALAEVVVLAALLAVPAGLHAQTPACDQLEGGQQQLAIELLASEHPYDCCDGSIADCLEQNRVCRLASRLADNICRRVGEGEDRDRIRRALSRRARSMIAAGPPAEIDLAGVSALGAEDAPVTVVVYACARCPYCSKLVPKLQHEVEEGCLAAAVRLVFKTFPIRGHEFSKEAGMAFMAASQQGRFWQYLRYSYERFDDFSVDQQLDWAEAVGMDRDAFAALLADPGIREALVESKKEGLRNGVDVTPTLFINGRHWVGDLSLEEVVDACEEERDAVQGRVYLDD